MADKLGLGGNRRRLGGHREATLCGVALVVRCQGLCGRSVAVVGDGAYRQLVAFLRDEEEVYLGPVVDGLAGGYGGVRAGGVHDHYVQRRPSAGCWMVRRIRKTGSEGCAFVLVSGACAIAGCASRASVKASKR